MGKSADILSSVESDLGLNAQYVRGGLIPVRNCWHFHSDGNAVDAIFYDEEDFRSGMNRIYTVLQGRPVQILAFVLMDTHFHFILYGDLDDCRDFVQEYIRVTSHYISRKYGERGKLGGLPLSYQPIEDDSYLKTAICYTLKNPVAAGLNFQACDYPWSSAPLMFRRGGFWSEPAWMVASNLNVRFNNMSSREWCLTMHTRCRVPESGLKMIGDLIFPGEYVAFQIAEKVFRSFKGFNYCMSKTKESDVEEHGGILSRLSIPRQEMRQHKIEMCQEFFGKSDLRSLSMEQRIKLARGLKSRYGSSVKQIARLCGLVYDEVKNLL